MTDAGSQSTARIRRTTAPPPEQRRERLVGTVVRGYRIEALLEHGDGAVTYAGRQVQPDRPVVLHALSPRLLADGRRLERLTRDVAALAALTHEHLLRVLELTPDDQGVRFLVTARPEARPLRELMRSARPVPPETATVILRQLARALLDAHRRDVLHLGLTPDVIGLADGPRVVLGGFGLARPIDLAAASGSALAEASYAAPELASGANDVDVRADIYALGAIAYELVTGVLPFGGASAADHLLARLRGPLVPANERVPAVSPALSALLGRMLARDREARPASLELVLRDLDQPSAAAPAGPEPPPVALGAPPRFTWPPELRAVLAAVGVAAALAIVLGVGPLRAVLSRRDVEVSAPAEVVAERALARLREEVTSVAAADHAALLEAFAAQHEGTRAAVAARKDAARLVKAREDERAAASRAALALAERLRTEGHLGPALDALGDPALAPGSAAPLREAVERDLAARGVVWLRAGSCRVGEQARERTLAARALYMDRHEVTNAAYARFVAATGARAPAAWRGPTPPEALAPLPVTGVTVREAAAFAAWRGGSLPTSIDWERAARGAGGATWPWGEAPDPKACNWAGARRGGPLAPGSFPLDVTQEGCADLAGNVAELVVDPVAAGAPPPATALARGGSYLTAFLSGTRGAFFQELGADETHPAVGFRCVYTAPPGPP